ncbi:hypothetical protein UP09_21480 [Bradyrhizobium sp. LTSP885]|nr:hypothetical protein UP09_21480 [Bradyrhizobium sp. LTSP885]
MLSKDRRIARSIGFKIYTADKLMRELAFMASRIALPARYPCFGTWPALMRADMAAAYLDYRDARELVRAVKRGEAPPPTSYQGTGRARRPVWSKASIDCFVASSRAVQTDGSLGEELASLV